MEENEKALPVEKPEGSNFVQTEQKKDDPEIKTVVTTTPDDKEKISYLEGTITEAMNRLKSLEEERKLVQKALARCWKKFPYIETFFIKAFKSENELVEKQQKARFEEIKKEQMAALVKETLDEVKAGAEAKAAGLPIIVEEAKANG